MVEHVLFLRHAKTRYNQEKRISGRSMELPIVETDEIVCDIPIDCVFCSPAVRCRQTLDLFLKQHTVEWVCFDQNLLERNMGIMEGELRCDMVEMYPHLFQKQKFRLHETPPMGESFRDFHERVVRFWEQVRDTYTGTVLVCAHNQVLKMLYFVIQGVLPTESEWFERSFSTGNVEQIF